MDEIEFSGHGIEILKRDGRLYVRYDAGEIATWRVEVEITPAEANIAKRSERDAYNILLRCESQKRPERRV